MLRDLFFGHTDDFAGMRGRDQPAQRRVPGTLVASVGQDHHRAVHVPAGIEDGELHAKDRVDPCRQARADVFGYTV